MRADLPIESVSGQRGWEWNRWQSCQDDPTAPSESTPRSSAGQTVAVRRQSSNVENACRHPDVVALEAEVDRKERRLQHIIDHYERLLAAENRHATTRSDAGPREYQLPMVVSTVYRWLTGR